MNFSRPGALDLSVLGGSPARSGPSRAAGAFVADATEQNFQQSVIDASMRYVVVLSLWSQRSPQSVEFNDLLATVVDSYGGQAMLVRVDVDAQPAIAQAIGAQSVPLVLGLVMGQPMPLFQSTADETQVRSVIDQLFQVAIQNGVTGRAQPSGQPASSAGPAADPRFADAEAALAANDVDAAIAEYERLAANQPGDAQIRERLAGAQVLKRTSGADLKLAREAAAAHPEDVDAQLLVADLDVSGGHADDAFGRLLDVIRRTAGDDRERVRVRLLELFTVVGADDPRVAGARRALATALF
jgi:putative thioredoxin